MPVIYVLCPDTDVPCGGIKQLYRHVDILNSNALEAYIVHLRKGFRCTWFENNTRISFLAKTKIRESDYLVTPEIYGELFCKRKKIRGVNRRLREFIGMSNNTVIFDQACYLSFNGYSTIETDINEFWLRNSIKAVLVVSEDSGQYINYVFPKLNVLRIHNYVNTNLFSYQHEKKKQICFMPRKLGEDAVQVINILKYRDALKGFDLIQIENMSEQEVARIMKESLIFLSFSYQEGCALPPVEAMACGCLVIGYDGRGGRECFSDEFTYPIEGGDIIGFAKATEEVLSQYNNNSDDVDTKRKKASEFVEKEYSEEREKEDVLHCWTKIFTLPSRI